MLKKWLKYICDPIDKTNLAFNEITEQNGKDVISGRLKSKSGHIYKIKNGVPILLNNFTQPISSVESFAYEWNTFDFDYGKKSWINDVINPIVSSVNYFKNKNVIDCGAGSGRQSLWIAEAGAKFVFSIELSDAATSIVRNVTTKFRDRIFVIQADIANLPIKKDKSNIDLAYCVNVIQHTKNPIKAVSEISKLLNQSSDLIFNIYLEKGRTNFLSILSYVRNFTRIIPYNLLKYFSYLITSFCYLLAYLPLIRDWVKKSLPIHHGFKETWLSVYDILGSHEYQKFYTENELSLILLKANLKIIKRSKYAMILKIR